jgi:NAD(P)-dependent dehydrogenase (short-subunit alcohol dehydrogenase family)
MRVFVAGASGAIGTRLVPQLVDRGHEVIGSSRSPGNVERLRSLGAKPVVLDLLDPAAVLRAVIEAEPDAIVHEATALADARFSRKFDRTFAKTNRLRTEGTDALLAAAREAGVGRIVAQSFASYRYAREGGPVKTEDDPLDAAPLSSMREGFAAMRYLDETVTEAGGSPFAMASSTAPPTTGLSSPSASGSSRSSAMAAASRRSFISTTPPRRPCWRSTTTEPASTTSSTTSPPPSASGCRRSRRRSAPSRRATCPAGSPGCSRAMPRS